MTVDDIIASLNVIKYYNPSMKTLYDSFVAQAPNIILNADAITAADEAFQPIYETLVNIEVALANCIHDYTYNIINPFDSIIVKNTIREQMCRDLFGLDANF
jgi:hypothetical protein